MRKKKATAWIVDQKIETGYSVSLFSNLIFLNGYRYALPHVITFTTDNSMPAWSQLEGFVRERMLGPVWNYEELLLIGSFLNDELKECKHASTLLRFEVG